MSSRSWISFLATNNARYSPQFNFGLPTWEPDPNFDIRNHVHQVVLKGGTDADLKAVAASIISSTLNRERPLWDLTLVRGLEGNRTGLVIRIHHCLADGISGVGIMNVLLDTTPTPEHLPARKAAERGAANNRLGCACSSTAC